MDVSPIIESLNREQREAVCTEASHALVLAGAGSGKTRVLTHRIAWLHQTQGVPLHAVLGLTFTNKAANEMRRRLAKMLNRPVGSLWVGTFHAICNRILNIHHEEAGLPQTFEILDAADQKRLLRRIIGDLNLDTTEFDPKKVQTFINRNKDDGIRVRALPEPDHRRARILRDIYAEYENRCRAGGVVDFAELLLATVEMLRDNEAVARRYRERFHTLLIDEFQDTNRLQYAWCRLLTQDGMRLFVVGDDDQSIYGWRGSLAGNMRDLEQHFPGLVTYKLERNYRSTATILDAANQLISHNSERLGKNLWTEENTGEPIVFYTATDERDEAEFVSKYIVNWCESHGRRLSETAILYRSNVQSRALEEALRLRGVTYRIYGGLRFYERAEVKDALAYLRLTLDARSDVGFTRVINTPARGIGEVLLARIRSVAGEQGISLWDAGQLLIDTDALPARAAGALRAFYKLRDDMSEEIREKSLAEQMEVVVYKSGLYDMYDNKKDIVKISKRENLEELLNDARLFEESYREISADAVAEDIAMAFIDHATLDAGDRPDDATDAVQMMTLHASKGLEFPLVVLTGLDEGLLPHALSLEEGNDEEERRLCYVGMTRARERLVMTRAEQRYQYGQGRTHSPESRFIAELPDQLLDRRPLSATGQTTPSMAQATPVTPMATDVSAGNIKSVKVGQRVCHRKFGEGVVTDFEGEGASMRARVRFSQHGEKWLVLSYAPMEICG